MLTEELPHVIDRGAALSYVGGPTDIYARGGSSGSAAREKGAHLIGACAHVGLAETEGVSHDRPAVSQISAGAPSVAS
jgi:hypothetical protein